MRVVIFERPPLDPYEMQMLVFDALFEHAGHDCEIERLLPPWFFC